MLHDRSFQGPPDTASARFTRGGQTFFRIQAQPLETQAQPSEPYSQFIRSTANDDTAGSALPLAAREELFARLVAFWQLDHDQGAALLGLKVGGKRHVAELLSGVTYFTRQDELDRVAELFEIRRILHGLYRDQANENAWLRRPQPLLQGQTPVSMMLRGHMTDIVKVRQLVETVAGL